MEYALESGDAGAARLEVLASVHAADTEALFDRLPLPPAPACLDVGCGPGAVTRLLVARAALGGGTVVGVDVDAHYVELARAKANASPFADRLRYEHVGVHDLAFAREFDLVYARFVLSHLCEPKAALRKMLAAAKPGGIVALEDVDFGGAFCHPPSPAFARYLAWYDAMTRGNGADPNFGRALYALLIELGIHDVHVTVRQPAFAAGPGKRLAPTTLAHIGRVLVERNIAADDAVAATLAELEAYAADETTLLAMPRIFQAWGRIPA